MAIGLKAQFTDVSTQERSVIPEFELLSWKSFPLLKYLTGGDDARPSLNNLSVPCETVKYEWIEKQDPPISGQLGAAIATTPAAGTAENLTFSLSTPGNTLFAQEINEGTVIQIGSELMWVTSANGSATVGVTRGYAGTTPATALINAQIFLAGKAHRETAAAPTARQIIPTMPWNQVQQFVDTISLTEIEQATKRFHGNGDKALDVETADRMRNLMVAMSVALYRGQRVAAAASVAGAFGGFKTFIPAAQRVPGGAANLTAAMVLTAMQNCYDNGGPDTTPDLIVCNSFNRRRLSTQFATTNVSTWRSQSDAAGGVKVDTLITDFGDVKVLLDPFCPTTEVYLLKSDLVGVGPLQGKDFKRTMLAKTGPQDSWMIHGAYTLEVRRGVAHNVIENLLAS
jgi:hypothetical protein